MLGLFIFLLCYLRASAQQKEFKPVVGTGLMPATGLNGPVNAAVYDKQGLLWLGGEFTGQGDTLLNGVAIFNATSLTYHPLVMASSGIVGVGEPGVEGGVLAIAPLADGSGAFIGGDFRTAGGLVVNGIASYYRPSSRFGQLRFVNSIGVNNPGGTQCVFALAIDPIAVGVYIGGRFATAAGQTVNGVAKWDGAKFSPLQTLDGVGFSNVGLATPIVYALAFNPSDPFDLWIGGSFEVAGGNVTVNHLARWSTSTNTFSPVVDQTSGTTIGVSGASLSGTIAVTAIGFTPDRFSSPSAFIGGAFADAGDVSAANCVARYNLTSKKFVSASLKFGFAPLTGVCAPDLATTRTVSAITFRDQSILVGGRFSLNPGLMIQGFAVWLFGNVPDSILVILPLTSPIMEVRAIAIIPASAGGTTSASTLVGGDFQEVGITDLGHLATYVSSPTEEFKPILARVPSKLGVMGPYVSTFYPFTHPVTGARMIAIGGRFTFGGGRLLNNMALVNTSTSEFIPVGTGLQGVLTVSGGLPASVNCFVLNGSQLFVGGDFQLAGVSIANSIAIFDLLSITTSTLGSCPSCGVSFPSTNGRGSVFAMAMMPSGHLLLAGRFSTSGSVTTNSIALFKQGAFEALTDSGGGKGILGVGSTTATVFALAVGQQGGTPGVFIGGAEFAQCGSVFCGNICFYAASAAVPFFSCLGPGLSDGVLSLAFSPFPQPQLAVGGLFLTTADFSAELNGVAIWNGNSFLPLRSAGGSFVGVSPYPGLRLQVRSVAFEPLTSNLVLGGVLRDAGPTRVDGVARWNGSAFFPLGTSANPGVGQGNGKSDAVLALLYESGDLLVGGTFGTIGDKLFNRMARYADAPLPTPSVTPSATISPSISASSTASASGSPSPSFSSETSSLPSISITSSETASSSASLSSSASESWSPSPEPTSSPSTSSEPSASPSESATPSSSPTPTPSRSVQPSTPVSITASLNGEAASSAWPSAINLALTKGCIGITADLDCVLQPSDFAPVRFVASGSAGSCAQLPRSLSLQRQNTSSALDSSCLAPSSTLTGECRLASSSSGALLAFSSFPAAYVAARVPILRDLLFAIPASTSGQEVTLRSMRTGTVKTVAGCTTAAMMASNCSLQLAEAARSFSAVPNAAVGALTATVTVSSSVVLIAFLDPRSAVPICGSGNGPAAPGASLTVSIGGIAANKTFEATDGSQAHFWTPSFAQACGGSSSSSSSSPSSSSSASGCGYRQIRLRYAIAAPPTRQLAAALPSVALPVVDCPPYCPGLFPVNAEPFSVPLAGGESQSTPGFADWMGKLVPAVRDADTGLLQPVSSLASAVAVTAGLSYSPECVGFEPPSSGACANASSPLYALGRCAFGTGDACRVCPQLAGKPMAICPGGFLALPLPGFYTASESSGVIEACPPPASRCGGWDPLLGAARCAQGFKPFSPSCSACDEGYYPRSTGVCVACPPSSLSALAYSFLLFIGAALAGLAGILFLTFLLSKAVGGVVAASFVRIIDLLVWILLLLQVIASAGKAAAPGLPKAVADVLLALSATQLENLTLPAECWKLYPFAPAVLQFVTVLVLSAVAVWLALHPGTPDWANKTMMQRRLWSYGPLAVFTLLTLLYSLVASTSMGLLSCDPVQLSPLAMASLNSDEDQAALLRLARDPTASQTRYSVSILRTNPSFVCWQGSHRPAGALAVVVLLLYTLAMPVWTFLFVDRRLKAIRGDRGVASDRAAEAFFKARKGKTLGTFLLLCFGRERCLGSQNADAELSAGSTSPVLHPFTQAGYRPSLFFARHADMVCLFLLAALQLGRPSTASAAAWRGASIVFVLLATAFFVVTRRPFNQGERWKQHTKVGSLLLAALAAILTHIVLAAALEGTEAKGVSGLSTTIVVLIAVLFVVLAGGFAFSAVQGAKLDASRAAAMLAEVRARSRRIQLREMNLLLSDPAGAAARAGEDDDQEMRMQSFNPLRGPSAGQVMPAEAARNPAAPTFAPVQIRGKQGSTSEGRRRFILPPTPALAPADPTTSVPESSSAHISPPLDEGASNNIGANSGANSGACKAEYKVNPLALLKEK